jgi:hypothetical protein
MAAENPTWGEERIANELKVKLGIRVSPRTVAKYLRGSGPVRTPDPKQRWRPPDCGMDLATLISQPSPSGSSLTLLGRGRRRPLFQLFLGLLDAALVLSLHQPGIEPRCELRNQFPVTPPVPELMFV